VCERDIPSTFMLLWVVRRAAEIQCASGPLLGADMVLDTAVRERCRGAAIDFGTNASFARLLFNATIRRMRHAAG
jgi:hypothetical protein